MVAWALPAAAQSLAGTTDSSDSDESECPAAIQNVDVTVGKVPRGATVEFTNPLKTNIADLRKLLREAAATLEYHSKLAALHPELVDKDEDVLPPVDIAVKETPKGARLTIQAEDPDDAAKVRVHVKHLETAWQADACVRGDKQGTVARAGRT